MRISIWLCALGVVVLFAFFCALTTIQPAEVAEASVVVGVLATLVTVRNLRVADELADRGGHPRVRRALNRQREGRGF